MFGRKLHRLCAVVLAAAAPVFAQPSASGAGGPNGDANRRICRVLPDRGSRLGGSRACHSAADWAELRRQTKQNVDHIQNARAWNSECGPTGRC
jgi:hypothetical protein